jgi:hypothetical protein
MSIVPPSFPSHGALHLPVCHNGRGAFVLADVEKRVWSVILRAKDDEESRNFLQKTKTDSSLSQNDKLRTFFNTELLISTLRLRGEQGVVRTTEVA